MARSSTRPSSTSSVLTCSARCAVRPYCRLIPASGGRKLPEISGGSAHQRGELPEAPVRGRDGSFGARQGERQAVGVVAGRLDPDGGAFKGSRPAAFGAAADGCEQLG